MRKWTAAAALCIALAAAGCGQQAKEKPAQTPEQTEEKPTAKLPEESEDADKEAPFAVDRSLPVAKGAKIAVVAKSTSGEYWKRVRAGMEDGVKFLNKAYRLEGKEKITMTFEGPDSPDRLTDMINTVDTVLAENPTVLCLAAGDENAGRAQLETAMENGIPVVLFDSGIQADEGLYAAYCASDNGEMGRIAAQKLAKELGERGETAVISHAGSDQTSRRRTDGFLAEMKNYPGITTKTLTLDEPEELGKFLDGQPKPAGLYCTNIDAAETVLALLKMKKLEGIAVVGTDGSSAQIQAIRDGREIGVVSQNPYRMGFQTIWTAACAALPENAERLPKKTLIDTAWLDASNLGDDRSRAYIYK